MNEYHLPVDNFKLSQANERLVIDQFLMRAVGLCGSYLPGSWTACVYRVCNFQPQKMRYTRRYSMISPFIKLLKVTLRPTAASYKHNIYTEKRAENIMM